jgi:hypothetical protein
MESNIMGFDKKGEKVKYSYPWSLHHDWSHLGALTED